MTDTCELLVTNAVVVNSDSTFYGHIAITGGKITALHAADAPGLPAAARILDAAGRTVIPGGVDGHCHVQQVTGRYSSLDTFETASIGALWGGTTTILDFGIPATDTQTPLAAARGKLALAQASRCDVGLHASVVHWDESVPAQLEELAELGIRSVKLYATNRGTTMASEDTILRVMKEMVRLDGLTYIHAEHDAMIEDCVRDHAARGEITAGHLHLTRPELAETASVREALAMAEYTGAAVYFVHQTVPEAVDLVAQARRRGLRAYSETCPHYLRLDEGVYASEWPERFACCPPMRSPETVKALRGRVAAGLVDTVASDHSCYDTGQKLERSDDVRFMPHGLPGVETRMPAAFTTLVREEGLPVQDFVRVFSTEPARINGLPDKGCIAPGFDADLVIFDPDEVRTVKGRELHMGTDFSPFEGQELAGWPASVVMAGTVVLEDGVFTDPGPVGRFLPRLGVSETELSGAPAHTGSVAS